MSITASITSATSSAANDGPITLPGKEWYQVSLGGSDGSALATTAVPGKVIGPSFAADEVADAIEAVIDTYRDQRAANERFIDTVKRLGLDPFKASANAVRRSTARAA